MGEGIGTALILGLVSFGLLLMVGLYQLIDYVFIDDEFEVSAPIKPQIKLVTDGKTVDTVYVYKFD
jgi:hypothetical protein